MHKLDGLFNVSPSLYILLLDYRDKMQLAQDCNYIFQWSWTKQSISVIIIDYRCDVIDPPEASMREAQGYLPRAKFYCTKE